MVCKSNIEADFLTSLQLHDSAVMDHQLDRPVANGLKGHTELPEERWGHWQVVASAGVGPGRNS